ncbi:MAG: lectin-like domain-containing protein [Lactobacillaceae bacterium]
MPMTNKSLSASQLAAQRSADFSSVLNKLLKQPFDLGSSLNPIKFNKEDTQNFFSPTGSATVEPSSTGGWGIINLNNDEQSKLGAMTLNTAIDMTQDFHFSWEVKISYSNYWDGPGDGIGFVLHPLYKPGEKITDLSSNNSQFLPTYFGRYINKAGHLVAVEDLNNLYNGQNLNSILNSSACPYGAFVATNYNGYSTVDTSTYKQLKNPINIVNNRMTMTMK